MKLEQELEIQSLLKNWRDERHLSIESQRDGLMGNLCEEMAEYYRAVDESEKIDALCDMYVFCMNSLGGGLKVAKDDLEDKNKKILLMYCALPSFKFYLLDNIELKLMGLKANEIIVDSLNLFLYAFMRNVEFETQALGYDFYKCMLETIKEISSRTGHYDKNIHKFVKDKSPEAKAKWYKADYEKCKIKG